MRENKFQNSHLIISYKFLQKVNRKKADTGEYLALLRKFYVCKQMKSIVHQLILLNINICM